MMKSKVTGAFLLVATGVPGLVWAQAPVNGQVPVTALAPEPGTAPLSAPPVFTAPKDVIDRIRDEGLNRSQVMNTISYLTDVIGPRLTASPSMKRANEWTRDTMTKWGMQNGHLEAWGPFGRGWVLNNFTADVTAPTTFPLIAFPKAWSPSTKGMLNAEVVYLEADSEADFAKYKGKLRGKIVLVSKPRTLEAEFTPEASRYTDEELKDLENNARPNRPGGPNAGGRPGPAGAPNTGGPNTGNPNTGAPNGPRRVSIVTARLNFLKAEGAALIVDNSSKGSGGTLFVQGASVPQDVPLAAPDWRGRTTLQAYYKQAENKLVPQVTMATEHYNRLVRILQAGEKVTMKVNIESEYLDRDLMGYNTVAEIPGTDPALKNEVVMMGGHLDSWHAGTGATDNAAGVGVAMEAARIIKSLGLQPRRTIRVALWSGEEQGIHGSYAYVKEHFGDLPSVPDGQTSALVKKADYDKFSGYFNLDNGTGKIRGIYLQGNSAVAPIFREWLKPFADLGASTITPRNTGGTDHLSFDRVGLPGFQFIQDTIEYNPRTHHSNQDVFDRLQADDLKQASTIMAAFVYQTAMMDQKLPRKPLTP